MNGLLRNICILVACFFSASGAVAESKSEIICSYAPSQSNLVASMSGAMGGVGTTAGVMAAATGLTPVVHSSGALILSGSAGYIAGTLGVPAATVAAAPILVVVSATVGGTAVILELVCAPKNHPELVDKINAAAVEFMVRFNQIKSKSSDGVNQMKDEIMPIARGKVISVKRKVSNIWGRIYKKDKED